MNTLYLILLIGALVCFLADAISISSPRIKLLPLGLALWVLVAVIELARIM